MECIKTRKLCKKLVDSGAIVVPYVGSQRQPNGYPDRIIWSKHWNGWVEFKDVTTRLASEQKYRIDHLNMRCKGSAVVCRFGTQWYHGTFEDTDGNTLAQWNNPEEFIWLLSQGLE